MKTLKLTFDHSQFTIDNPGNEQEAAAAPIVDNTETNLIALRQSINHAVFWNVYLIPKKEWVGYEGLTKFYIVH